MSAGAHDAVANAAILPQLRQAPCTAKQSPWVIARKLSRMPRKLTSLYDVGEMAWLNSPHVTLKAVGTRKLLPQWLGPFKILAKPTSVYYTLDTPAHYRIHRTSHMIMLRRAYDNGAGVQHPPVIMIEEVETLWPCLQ